jgi:dTDP-glucose 4,6-dehydratase
VKTTLITGGAGFIGSNFVEKLFDLYEEERIVVLDAMTYAANLANIPERIQKSPRFRFILGDIRDEKIVSEAVAYADQVIHFAAESHVTRSLADDKPFFETDVMGTQTIAAAVSRNSWIKKFVHISTSEVYGTAVQAPMTEDHPLNPCTPYAAAKAGADRLVYAYRETYKIPTVIIRPFNNYGPKQHLEKVVPRFITSALMDEPLLVHGDGLMTRDWIFVEDTCEAILRAATSEAAIGQVFNVGTGVDVSVLEIAEQILDLTGKPRSLIRHIEARPGQVDRHIAATKKAEVFLSWAAQVNLAKGLQRTVEWYKANPTWWETSRSLAPRDITDEKRKLSGSY